MAWTTMRSWVTGEVVTAAELNQQLRDNGNFLANGHGVLAYRVAGLSIATGTTPTLVGLDGEEFDTDVYHDLVTNNSRLTVPAGMGGLALVIGGTNWAVNATGDRIIDVRKNAAGAAAGGTDLQPLKVPATSASSSPIITVSRPTVMVAGDHVELFAAQTSGGTLAINAGTTTFLALVFIGF